MRRGLRRQREDRHRPVVRDLREGPLQLEALETAGRPAVGDQDEDRLLVERRRRPRPAVDHGEGIREARTPMGREGGEEPIEVRAPSGRPLPRNRIEGADRWPAERDDVEGFAGMQVGREPRHGFLRGGPSIVEAHAPGGIDGDQERPRHGGHEIPPGRVPRVDGISNVSFALRVDPLREGRAGGTEVDVEVAPLDGPGVVDVGLCRTVSDSQDGDVRVAEEVHMDQGRRGLDSEMDAQIGHAVPGVDGEPVVVVVGAVPLREGHLQRCDRRPSLLRRDRDRNPVNVPRRIVLDQGRILALGDRREEVIQSTPAVSRGGIVHDVPDLEPKVRDELVALFEGEEDLTLLGLVARVVELLDDDDAGEAFRQPDLHLRAVHLGWERRGRLEDLAEGDDVIGDQEERGKHERNDQGAARNPHAPASVEGSRAAKRARCADQASSPKKRTIGQVTARRIQRPE